MAGSPEPRRGAQSVDRALVLLQHLGNGPASLTALAERIGVHKSTASRLLQALEARGFVRRDSQKRYRLGTQLITLAHRGLEDLDLRSAARPYLAQLTELSDDRGQTVHLAVRDGLEVVYIDKREGRTPVRMYSQIGGRSPVYCTALGKAILACLHAEELAPILARLELRPRTAKTVVSLAALRAELDLTRARGYALDERENEDFIHCIAAPVRNAGGNAEGAISISAPVSLLALEDLLALAPLLISAAEGASREFGWRPSASAPPTAAR